MHAGERRTDGRKDRGVLDRECELFCRYLTGEEPGPYLLAKYEEAHRFRDLESGAGPFDRFLVRAAGRDVFSARLVDAYCGIFARRSVFRKKMMLLLAILECSFPAHGAIDTPEMSGRVTLYLKFMCHTFSYLVTLALSLPLLVGMYVAEKYRSQRPASG